MCGIIYVQSEDERTTRELAFLQFAHQEVRGKSGFGILEVDTGKLHRSLTPDKFLDNLCAMKSKELLIHHRMPTSTSNSIPSTHPFVVTKGNLTLHVVHNGVIQNPDWVLNKLGIKKEALVSYNKDDGERYNDSEALALDFIDAVVTGRKTLYSYGAMVILAYDLNKRKLYVYKNDRNPMNYLRSEGATVFASMAPTPMAEAVKSGKIWVFDPKKITFSEGRALADATWNSEFVPKREGSSYPSWENKRGRYHSQGTAIMQPTVGKKPVYANDDYYEELERQSEHRHGSAAPHSPAARLDTVVEKMMKDINDKSGQKSFSDLAQEELDKERKKSEGNAIANAVILGGRYDVAFNNIKALIKKERNNKTGAFIVAGKPVPCHFNGQKMCVHVDCVVKNLLKNKVPGINECPSCSFSEMAPYWANKINHSDDENCQVWLEKETDPFPAAVLGPVKEISNKGVNFIDRLSDIEGNKDKTKKPTDVIPVTATLTEDGHDLEGVDSCGTEFLTDLDYDFDDLERRVTSITYFDPPKKDSVNSQKDYDKLLNQELELMDIKGTLPVKEKCRYQAERELHDKINQRLEIIRDVLSVYFHRYGKNHGVKPTEKQREHILGTA